MSEPGAPIRDREPGAPTRHHVILGDARAMDRVADRSIHLVITSPPYWQLKDYGAEAQIGFNHTYEDYINHLNLVWKECHRILHPGCRLCINIGDQFARSAYYGRYKVIPIRTEIIRFCETVGFDYMGAIIWQKVTTCNTTGGATIMGSFPFPRNGILKLDYEFILLFRKGGKAPGVDREAKEGSRMTTEQWNRYFSGHWQFAGEKRQEHLAVFPEELPKRLIRMFSFAGETVLDPFLGSATTSLAAAKEGRHSAGYEINSAFLPMIRQKLDPGLLNPWTVEVETEDKEKGDFTRALDELPYRFEDPVVVERKKDPRKKRFGSRVDARPAGQRESYFRVKKVLSPEKVVLDSGQTLCLLGVQEISGTRQAAMEFLKKKTASSPVYFRKDEAVEGEGQDLPCYLYLKNRTFLNLHLIQQGLVEVDASREYKYRERFLKKRGKRAGREKQA